MVDLVISEEDLRALLAVSNLPAVWPRDVQELYNRPDGDSHYPFDRLTRIYDIDNGTHCIIMFTRNGVFEWRYQTEDPVQEDVEGMVENDMFYFAVVIPIAMRQLFKFRVWDVRMRQTVIPPKNDDS